MELKKYVKNGQIMTLGYSDATIYAEVDSDSIIGISNAIKNEDDVQKIEVTTAPKNYVLLRFSY